MIESKEEYELIARDVQGGRDWTKLNETFEALRKVARAAIYYKQEKQKFLSGRLGYDPDAGKILDDALDALPGWMIKDD